jgi:hypothetical protein
MPSAVVVAEASLLVLVRLAVAVAVVVAIAAVVVAVAVLAAVARPGTTVVPVRRRTAMALVLLRGRCQKILAWKELLLWLYLR